MNKPEKEPVIDGLVSLYTPALREDSESEPAAGRVANIAIAGVTGALGSLNLFFANCRIEEPLACIMSDANREPLIGGALLMIVAGTNVVSFVRKTAHIRGNLRA